MSSIIFVGGVCDNKSDLLQITKDLHEEWTMDIIDDGLTAISLLDRKPVNAVVVNMKLPDMSGIEFLKRVKDVSPSVLRIIASDKMDKSILLQSGGYVHQYVPRNFDLSIIKRIVGNCINLRNLLSKEVLRSKIASIKSLPSPPKVYKQIVGILKSHTASTKEIAEIIRNDVSITTKLLQVVNSAYFGTRNPVESVFHAINLLGLDTVQSIVFSVGIFNQFQEPNVPNYSLEIIHKNSVAVGAKAKLFAGVLGLAASQKEEALMSGMLHDVGKLVTLTSFQPEFEEAIRLSVSKTIPLYQAQSEVLGVNDAEIGAFLLLLWGQPYSVLEPLAYHYKPSELSDSNINTLTAVHLAYAIHIDEAENKGNGDSALDMEYVSALNLEENLGTFKDLSLASVAV